MNLWLKIKFWWKAYLTNYFYQDHFLQPATREVLLNEDFSDNKFHYDWDLPGWATWGGIIFKNSQRDIHNNLLYLTTAQNSVQGEPKIMSGEITSNSFLNRTYGFFEVCMKPCGEWDAAWLFQSKDIPSDKEKFEIDFSEFECDTPCAFTATIWTYGLDGKTSKILGTNKFRARKSLTNNYHVFACDWQKDSVSIYLDGVLLWKFTGKIPNTDMFLWVNNQYKGGQLPVSNYTKAIRVQA